MYIEDREMTPMSPIESTDVPNTHHQTQYNNRNNSTAHSESNHNNQQQQQQQQYNRISSSSSYNQKPYIPGKYNSLILTLSRLSKESGSMKYILNLSTK